MKKILILEDSLPPGLDVLTRVRSFVDLRVGYSTILQRLIKKYPNAKFYYKNSNEEMFSYFLEEHPDILPFQGKEVDLEINAQEYLPWELLRQVPVFIEEDLSLFSSISKWKNKFKPKIRRFELVGKEKFLHIHESVQIYPGVVIDVKSGPVIIDKDVVITSFSFLEGPLYIGASSRIDNARITGGTVIGENCRIGGEVENSIVQDYSNKHHEGFLGHSVLGSWVNMGALSTTSDLKNNYSVVEIQSKNGRLNTGTIKFGSVIGDFSKIGIGVMLNTGTVIDIGSNLIAPRVSGYIPPFTWLDPGKLYELERFFQDTKKIMARRSKELKPNQQNILKAFYEKCFSESNPS